MKSNAEVLLWSTWQQHEGLDMYLGGDRRQAMPREKEKVKEKGNGAGRTGGKEGGDVRVRRRTREARALQRRGVSERNGAGGAVRENKQMGGL